MPYGMNNPGDAPAPAMPMPGEEGQAGAGAPGYEEDTTTEIPASMTGGKTFAPGDNIVLEVVSVSQGGGLVVKYASDKGEEGKGEDESWEDGFRKEMSAAKPTEEAS